MIRNLSQLSPSLRIPKLDRRIITPRYNRPRIWWKRTSPHPILMRLYSSQKLLLSNIPKFQSFVISTRNQQLAITREIQIPDRACVGLQNFWLPLNAVCPEPDRLVGGARGYQIACWVDVQGVDWPRMSCEFKRAEILFEIPDHDDWVVGAGDELFEIWVEFHGGDEATLSSESFDVFRKIWLGVNVLIWKRVHF